MNLIKSSMAAFGLFLMLAAPGCANPQPQNNNPTAQCASDRDCNKSDACRVCQGGQCATVSDCCTADSQCGSGQKCWNEPGKAYGKCGAK